MLGHAVVCERRCLTHGGGCSAVLQSACVYIDGLLQEVVGGERGRLDGKALKTAHQPIIPLLPPWSKRHGGRRDGRNKRDSGRTMKVRRELSAMMAGRKNDERDERIRGKTKTATQEGEEMGFIQRCGGQDRSNSQSGDGTTKL